MRVLGIDYGRRRIGLALSDASGTLARPWKAIAGDDQPARAAGSIVREAEALAGEEEGLSAVVIGLPRRLNGEPNDQTAVVTTIAELIRTRLTVPLVLQDERLTSREAESRLARRVKDWRQRKALLDAAAAAVILQDYLDARSGPPPGPTDGWEDEHS